MVNSKMPRVSRSNFNPDKRYEIKNNMLLLGSNPKASAGNTEVTEVILQWGNAKPCPPCEHAFWWSTPPKTMTSKASAAKKIQTPTVSTQQPKLPQYQNVMHDRRVVRGSNFTPAELLTDVNPFDKGAIIRRRHAIRKRANCKNVRNILGTPPPVEGRHHKTIQTNKYLEDLFLRPTEMTIETQTDLFLEKPPTPPYVPAKTGVDASTEIEAGELFQFEIEAQPIIDVLVDSCIEQSIMTMAHEQEIAEIRKKQQEFLALREAELAELRRLEQEEMRLQAEKMRRLRQETIAKDLDDEMQRGVTAAKLLQGHIAGLLPEVLENLEPATDVTKKEALMKNVCPWLSAEVAEEVGQIVDSREILTVIIQEIIKQRAEAYAGYSDPLTELPEIPADEGELEAVEDECCPCESDDTLECETTPKSKCPPAEET